MVFAVVALILSGCGSREPPTCGQAQEIHADASRSVTFSGDLRATNPSRHQDLVDAELAARVALVRACSLCRTGTEEEILRDGGPWVETTIGTYIPKERVPPCLEPSSEEKDSPRPKADGEIDNHPAGTWQSRPAPPDQAGLELLSPADLKSVLSDAMTQAVTRETVNTYCELDFEPQSSVDVKVQSAFATGPWTLEGSMVLTMGHRNAETSVKADLTPLGGDDFDIKTRVDWFMVCKGLGGRTTARGPEAGN